MSEHNPLVLVPYSERAHALLAERARTAFVPGATPVASPCISICRMNADFTLCEGCYRTLDDIRLWSGADDAERRVIWTQLLLRAGMPVPPATAQP